jgi:hypothetical protein
LGQVFHHFVVEGLLVFRGLNVEVVQNTLLMLTHLQHVKLISIVFIGRFLEHKEVVVHIPLEQIVLQGSLEDQLA